MSDKIMSEGYEKQLVGIGAGVGARRDWANSPNREMRGLGSAQNLLRPRTVLEELQRRKEAAEARIASAVREQADAEIELQQCELAIAALTSPSASVRRFTEEVIRSETRDPGEVAAPEDKYATFNADPFEVASARTVDEPRVEEINGDDFERQREADRHVSHEEFMKLPGVVEHDGTHCPVEVGASIEIWRRSA